MHRMLRAFGPIVLFQTLAEKMHCHSDNRVDLRIEIVRAPKGVYRDVVFLDIVGRSLEMFFANEVQGFDQIARSTERLRF